MSTEEVISNIIKELVPGQTTSICVNMNLIDDLGFDSINMLQLILELEERFNISLSDDDLDIDNFKSVKSITTLIEKNYVHN